MMPCCHLHPPPRVAAQRPRRKREKASVCMCVQTRMTMTWRGPADKGRVNTERVTVTVTVIFELSTHDSIKLSSHASRATFWHIHESRYGNFRRKRLLREQCRRTWPDRIDTSRLESVTVRAVCFSGVVCVRAVCFSEASTYDSRERRKEQGRAVSSIDMSVPKVGCV